MKIDPGKGKGRSESKMHQQEDALILRIAKNDFVDYSVIRLDAENAIGDSGDIYFSR